MAKGATDGFKVRGERGNGARQEKRLMGSAAVNRRVEKRALFEDVGKAVVGEGKGWYATGREKRSTLPGYLEDHKDDKALEGAYTVIGRQ